MSIHGTNTCLFSSVVPEQQTSNKDLQVSRSPPMSRPRPIASRYPGVPRVQPIRTKYRAAPPDYGSADNLDHKVIQHAVNTSSTYHHENFMCEMRLDTELQIMNTKLQFRPELDLIDQS
ncbi:hypothetical protein QTP88_004108 [Uroleucon formosanum]